LKHWHGLLSSFFIILIAFNFCFAFVVAVSIQVGTDPTDDIKCGNRDVIGDWWEDFDPDNMPTAEEWQELFERGFEFSTRPDYIDVIAYGVEHDSECNLWVQVQNENDIPSCSHPIFFAIIVYNDTFYNEQFVTLGLFDPTNFLGTNMEYLSNFNGSNHYDNITLDSTNNKYEFPVPCGWITETDPNDIDDFLYGILLSVCIDDSGVIVSLCFDVFPNSIWNQNFGDGSDTFGGSTGGSYTGGDTNIFNYDWTTLYQGFMDTLWLWIILILLFIGLLIYAVAKSRKSK